MTILALTFTDATFAHPAIRDRFDLLLGVEAVFALKVDDRLIYTEPMFPIVELREALAAWLPPKVDDDFEFVSMESDERGLVWLRRQPSGRWRAGSILQDDITFDELTDIDVIDGCQAFISAVDEWVRGHLGVEVSDVLSG
jgi:hypothetical protein